MAKRQGALEDLFGLASRLPWQVDVGLAALSFALLHRLAAVSGVKPKAAQLGQLGSVVIVSGLHTISTILQVVLPLVFLVGALLSFIKRSRGARLYGAAVANPGMAIAQMSWRQFEALIAEAFRRKGFEVKEKGGSQADGGVDLVVTQGAARFLVQCKHWRSQRVGVSVVRELQGVVSADGAAGGYVVTGGTFTSEAREFAGRTKIELLGGRALESWISGVIEAHILAPAVETTSPSCPKCGAEMVRRVANRGKYMGRPFWGCAQYPKCTGIVGS